MHTNKWVVFTLVAVAQFMVVLDTAITNVALPSIEKALNFSSPSALQWVVTAYALAFGGFLLLGGRAADLYGRKRILIIGMVCFTIISFLIGISHSATMLIVLRALQGLAGAMMTPSALSIVLVTFSEGAERNRALGFWSLIATGGAAVGVLLGGVLTQYFGWEWNFFINVPVGIIVAFLLWRYAPAHEQEERRANLDLPGAVLVTAGLITFVYAISQAPAVGWLSTQTLGLGGLALLMLAGFVYNESRAKHPLMPLRIFTIRNVVGANLMMAPLVACMFGTFFLTSLYIQTVMHLSPVITGLAFLPFPIVLGFISTNIPRFVSRYGFKPFLMMGPIIIAIGLLWLARLPVDGSYWFDLLPAFIVMPLGIGMTMMPIIAAATSGVPGHEAGLASGLVTTSQQMGGALGLAILSGVATSAGVGGGLVSLVHGYDVAFLTGSIFIALAFLVSVTVIKGRRPNHQPVVQYE